MHFKRALALCAVLGISVLAGCGGHSGATPPLDATAGSALPDTTSTSAPRTTETTATPTAGLVGKVVYVTSGKFELQGGSHIGYIYVYTNSGTTWSYNGLTLKAGVYAKVYGTGSLRTSVTATSVSLSTSGTEGPISVDSVASTTTETTATPSPTAGLVGKIVYVTSGKFEVQAGSIGYIYIYTNSGTHWTYNGLSLKAGYYATVYGTGSLSTSVTATSVSLSTSGTAGPISVTSGSTSTASPTTTAAPATTTSTPAPTSGVPHHVQTAEYLTNSTLSSTSPSVYAPYLSWAYTLTGNMGKTRAAGIKTVIYTDPVMPKSGLYEYNEIGSTYSSVRAQGCTGTYTTNYGGTGWVADPTKSAAASYFTNVINYYVNKVANANPGYSHPYDLIFVDNAGQPYGATPMPCDFSDSGYGSALDSAMAATGQPLLLNALSTSPSKLSTYVSRLKGSNIQGGEYEHCFDDRQWSTEENAQLQAIALVKSQGKRGPGFWCYIDGSEGMLTGSTIVPKRIFYYASFLLTYDPNYSVYQVAFATPSTFKVYPETGFVPMNPVSTPSSVTSLLTSSGAYVQRYSSCYYRGSLIGQCEIAVNPGSSTVSVPNPAGLSHSMVLSGGGVLDGGTATFKGSRIYSLAPGTAAIMVP